VLGKLPALLLPPALVVFALVVRSRPASSRAVRPLRAASGFFWCALALAALCAPVETWQIGVDILRAVLWSTVFVPLVGGVVCVLVAARRSRHLELFALAAGIVSSVVALRFAVAHTRSFALPRALLFELVACAPAAGILVKGSVGRWPWKLLFVALLVEIFAFFVFLVRAAPTEIYLALIGQL
jgi:hypothetical protein